MASIVSTSASTRDPSNIKVLFFDVFGTCVNQRGTVADELFSAAQEALKTNKSLSDKVREKAEKMTYQEWFEFGGDWNKADAKFVQESIAKHNAVDWKAVDRHRIELLPQLLAKRGLVVPDGEGSLWNEKQIENLGRVWHRLNPWPDTCPGMSSFNKKFSTVALSNTYNDLMRGLVKNAGIPFTEVYTADLFESFKPRPEVYLGAAKKMGVKPEECALVAAHLYDLKAAKEHGYYAIYVERPFEEKAPELRGEGIPDMWIKEGENGFVTVAERLGIQDT